MAAADVARYQRYLQPASKHVLLSPSRKPSTNVYSSLYLPRTDFDQEHVRLTTYLMWPSWAPKSVVPIALAKNGFYYTGDSDETRCFSCNLTVKNWKADDVPEVVHHQRSSNCAFLRTTTVSNQAEAATANIRNSVGLASSAEKLTASSLRNAVSHVEDSAAGVVPETMAASQNLEGPGSFHRTSCITFTHSTSMVSAIDEQATRLAALKMENEKMRNSMTCRKCHSRQVKTLFLPCAHLVTCDSCADTVDYCLQCNARILGTVITYLA